MQIVRVFKLLDQEEKKLRHFEIPRLEKKSSNILKENIKTKW